MSNRAQELKLKFAPLLKQEHELAAPEGLPTGFAELDQYLLWNGFPKGGLSLLTGNIGQGGTSLWLNAAISNLKKNQRSAWINSEWLLTPHAFVQNQCDLQKLLIVQKPDSTAQLFWLMQELLSSGLFNLIGCALEHTQLHWKSLRVIQGLARHHNAAVVFLCESLTPCDNTIFNLSLHLQKNSVQVRRAQQRPTPHRITRKVTYDRFTQQKLVGAEDRARIDAPPTEADAHHETKQNFAITHSVSLLEYDSKNAQREKSLKKRISKRNLRRF